jgi:multidrug efflux system membrane fusion protein
MTVELRNITVTRAEGSDTVVASGLKPGERVVTVALTVYEQKDAIVAPSAAIQNGPNGQYVFVVGGDMTVELRNITVTRAEGSDTVVASGLKPGERVVTVGQLRLGPGTRVAEDRGAKAS